MIFKTKNGVFVSSNALQELGLAVAFNIDNFVMKLNKILKKNPNASLSDKAVKNLLNITELCLMSEIEEKGCESGKIYLEIEGGHIGYRTDLTPGNISVRLEGMSDQQISVLSQAIKEKTLKQIDHECKNALLDIALKKGHIRYYATHTVLAQYDGEGKARILNAGGLLTLAVDEQPKGFVMLQEKDGLQLGFGKVELKDFNQGLFSVQAAIDKELGKLLVNMAAEFSTIADFIQYLKHGSTITGEFGVLADVLNSNDQDIRAVAVNSDVSELVPSFNDRLPINPHAHLALQTAALREMKEELEYTIQGGSVDSTRYTISQAFNRQATTDFVRNVLQNEGLTEEQASKFSAKEFHFDIESVTFDVVLNLSQKEFEMFQRGNCNLVSLEENGCITLKITDLEKGFFNTSIPDSQPILGGGNQFVVAYACQKFNCTFVGVLPSTASVTSSMTSGGILLAPSTEQRVSAPTFTA